MNARAVLFPETRSGNPPRREFTRDVPKHFDGGDIDNNGRWYGEEMCCLECRETKHMRVGITATYLLATLDCGECGEPFAEYWV
jgi:hypothetical protein